MRLPSRLLARLLIRLLALALTVLPTAARASSEVDEAAQAAALGDVPRARELLGGLLSRDFSDTRALFVQACVELEAGNLSVAEGLAARLRRLRPHSQEPHLLAAVVAERQRKGGPWLDTFVNAWKQAGRPDPSEGGFIPRGLSQRRRLQRQERAALGDGQEGFLVDYGEGADPAALVGQARELLATGSPARAGGAPRPVQLVALAVLTSDRRTEREREGDAERVRNALATLAVADRAQGYYSVWALLEGTSEDDPLTDVEAWLLTPVLARQVFALPLPELYEAFRLAYARADPALAPAWAMRAARSALSSPDGKLFKRTLLTAQLADGERRQRALALLTFMARQLLGGRSLEERLEGTAALLKASELVRDDPEALSRVEDQRRHTLELLENGRRFGAQFTRWPVAGLLRELSQARALDEVAFLESLGE